MVPQRSMKLLNLKRVRKGLVMSEAVSWALTGSLQ